jgi:hypothetical protein
MQFFTVGQTIPVRTYRGTTLASSVPMTVIGFSCDGPKPVILCVHQTGEPKLPVPIFHVVEKTDTHWLSTESFTNQEADAKSHTFYPTITSLVRKAT